MERIGGKAVEPWLRTALVAVGIGTLVAVFTSMFRSGKPLRRLFGSCVQGLCAIAAVNVAAMFTGVSLGFSWLSTGTCAALGVPGVVTMLLLKVIMAIN